MLNLTIDSEKTSDVTYECMKVFYMLSKGEQERKSFLMREQIKIIFLLTNASYHTCMTQLRNILKIDQAPCALIVTAGSPFIVRLILTFF